MPHDDPPYLHVLPPLWRMQDPPGRSCSRLGFFFLTDADESHVGIGRHSYRQVPGIMSPLSSTCARIGLSGGRYAATISVEDLPLIERHAWREMKTPAGKVYARTNIGDKVVSMHRLILGVHGAGREIYVDHIDGNGLNNVRTNIRLSDHTRNRWNARTNAVSGYRGVSKTLSGWAAKCYTNHSLTYGGVWKTAIEAALAYNDAVRAARGTYAGLNVVPKDETRAILEQRLREAEEERARIERWLAELG